MNFVRLNTALAYFIFIESNFNSRTCECECAEAVFGSQVMMMILMMIMMILMMILMILMMMMQRAMCETRSTTYWDSKSCQCRSKSVAPRETDAMMANCLEDYPMMAYTRKHNIPDIVIIVFFVTDGGQTDTGFYSRC